MVALERILYPSNKLAVGAFMVVLVLAAILSAMHVTSYGNLISITIGVGLGWFGHIIAIRHHRVKESLEFRPWEVNLKRAQNQLDSVRSI